MYRDLGQEEGEEKEKKKASFPFNFSQHSKRNWGYIGKKTEYLETWLFNRQVRKQGTMWWDLDILLKIARWKYGVSNPFTLKI